MSGEKFDDLKDRWDLLPWGPVQAIVDALTYGADLKPRPDGGRGYGDRNWEDGLKFSRVFGALMRHLLKAWHGSETDEESTLFHMGQAGCCWSFLCHYMLDLDRYKEFDDRPILHPFRDDNRDWTELLEQEDEVAELRAKVDKLQDTIACLSQMSEQAVVEYFQRQRTTARDIETVLVAGKPLPIEKTKGIRDIVERNVNEQIELDAASRSAGPGPGRPFKTFAALDLYRARIPKDRCIEFDWARAKIEKIIKQERKSHVMETAKDAPES
jgi:hypothetical protein